MCWFGGYAGATLRSPSPRPAGARLLWDGPFPLWAVGQCLGHQARVIDQGSSRAAVIGPCGGTDITFAVDALTDAVTARPGAYTVIRADHRQLTVFTDLGGACPLYTTTFGGGIAWGSSARALAELTGAGVDVRWLAGALADSAVSASGSGSPFTGVRAAPPGTRITMRPGGGLVVMPLWLIRPDTVTGAAQRLRHALEGGVATRVATTSTPTCDLSGGLDSTSLCFLACEHLPPAKTVTAVTLHPDGLPDCGGDLGYAQAAVRHAGSRIAHRLLHLTNEHLPYSGLDRVPATDEPAPSTVSYSRLAAEFTLLAELGSDCHLTGDGGDSLLHPHGYLTDLVRSGRWIRLIGHTLGWARLQRCSPWTLLAAALPRGHTAAAADWLTPQAIDLATQDDGVSEGRVTHRLDANTRTLREVQTVGRTARADAQFAEAFGLTIHNPYTDSSVIAAALSVPPWQRGDPWRYKPLLTMAVGDLLPPAIATRTTKGSNDPGAILGYGRQVPDSLENRTEGYGHQVRGSLNQVRFTVYDLDGEPGPVGLSTLLVEHQVRTAEFIIVLGAAARGRGLATEATLLTLDYGFHVSALRMIWLKVLAPNTAGIRAYTSAGFKPAGRLRQSGYWLGEVCDEILMDALSEDFSAPSAVRGLITGQ